MLTYCDRGFPSKPSSLAFDDCLRLIAIGTSKGEIRIYGSPGVQLTATTTNGSPIKKLCFLPYGQGRLLCFLESGMLEIFELNHDGVSTVLEPVASSTEEVASKLRKATTFALLERGMIMVFGSENGDVMFLNISTMTFQDYFIRKDSVMRSIPDDYKMNPGVVEAICPHPLDSSRLLIGYTKGLLVLWNIESNALDQIFMYNQQIESICWYNNGMNFASSHSDGSYILWKSNDSADPFEVNSMPYGPYPCRSISKILVKTGRSNNPFVIFSGGLPRAQYSDKNTVSVIRAKSDSYQNHVAFEFSTRVIDFLTVDKKSPENSMSTDDPQCLIILLDEELVAIDLNSDSWPVYRLPYLLPAHASGLICTTSIQVSSTFYSKLTACGNSVFENFSDRPWPKMGGMCNDIESNFEELLITGHEDGSVMFWNIMRMDFPLIYRLQTADYFFLDTHANKLEEDTWPPFRKVGIFDPFCDDARIGIQKIAFSADANMLAVAGSCGQIILFFMSEDESEVLLEPKRIVLVDGSDDKSLWKGNETLKTKKCISSTGYKAKHIFQLIPPSPVTVLCLNDEAGLLIAGSVYGFCIVDFIQFKVITSKHTIDPSNLHFITGESAISRGRSLKKSLRESFRRLRKGRRKESVRIRKDQIEEKLSQRDDLSPIERQVESREFRPPDEQSHSLVRSAFFCSTTTVNNTTLTSSAFVGTNFGHIYIFTFVMPSEEKRHTEPVVCTLGKEIRLKHRAPVMSIGVTDVFGKLLTSFSSSDVGKNLTVQHRLIICSEEQFKIFSLPHLKPICKYKITAMEGARVRKIAFTTFQNPKDKAQDENCLCCLTNTGELSIFSLPSLRKNLSVSCMKAQDINGLVSFTFTKRNHALMLLSPGEFREVSFSTYSQPIPVQIPVNADSRFALQCCVLSKNASQIELESDSKPLTSSVEEIQAAPYANETENKEMVNGECNNTMEVL